MDKNQTITIIGGGLAGCEAAYQLSKRGVSVDLYEMRPKHTTDAHKTENLAELVCSNSLGSKMIDRSSGLLSAELRMLDSLLIRCAEQASVPAGNALAVDRSLFSQNVEAVILHTPNIRTIRTEITDIPEGPTIIASGPLTSEAFAKSIATFTGCGNLFFYDAIAPVVSAESIDFSKAYRASRYGKGVSEDGDYINCPFTKEEYYQFVEDLKTAERVPLRSFENAHEELVDLSKKHFFEGCLPVEVLASRAPDALAFGPMRPVGLTDPNTGKRPWAVVQLRQDNLSGSLYNMVGFQTNLKYTEQKRIFTSIPGLERCEFIRYGEMHRNTFISSPGIINPTMQTLTRPNLFFAGQIAGAEGYIGNIATGLTAGISAARYMIGYEPLNFPLETILGSLTNYLAHAEKKSFQPMKANFGILPVLDTPSRAKTERGKQYAERSITKLSEFIGLNLEIF